MLEQYHVEQVDIVAHSFGGLVARQYVETKGGDAKVRNLVMIATPTTARALPTT